MPTLRILSCLMFGLTCSLAQNLVLNPSFEDPSITQEFIHLTHGSTAMPGWTIGSDNPRSPLAVSLVHAIEVSEQEPGTVTGKRLWTFRAGHTISAAPAVGPDGTVYFTANDRKIYAVDANGRLRWTVDTGSLHFFATPTVDENGNLYVGTGAPTNALIALNSSGEELWRYVADGEFLAAPTLDRNGTVVIGSDDGWLHAIGSDGNQIWQFPTEGNQHSSAVIGSDGTIYVGSGRRDPTVGYTVGVFFALDMDGTERWRFSGRGPFISGSALAADGTVYLSSADNLGQVFALDPSGNQLWNYSSRASVRSAPIIGSDGAVYFSNSNNHVFALNPDGTLRWDHRSDWRSAHTPALDADGHVIIHTTGSNLIALGPDGSEAWRVERLPDNDDSSSPAITDSGVIYFGTGPNLVAVQGSAGAAQTDWPMFQRDPARGGHAPTRSTPFVTWESPEDQAIFLEGVEIPLEVAAIGGSSPISEVSFLADDEVLSTLRSRPFAFRWRNAAPGTYSVSARATEESGAMTETEALVIRVNAPPTIRWLNPNDADVLLTGEEIPLAVEAADPDGTLERVDFFENSNLIGSVAEAPFQWTWMNLQQGDFLLSAKAVDDLGGETTATIEIESRPRLFVRLIAPRDNAFFFTPANVELQTLIQSLDSPVATVRFFEGSNLLREITQPPYAFTWAFTPIGVYELRAEVVDDRGMSVRSAPVRIQVLPPDHPLALTWVAETGSWFEANNWNARVPMGLDDVTIDNGGTVLLGTGAAAAKTLDVANEFSGALRQSGGSLEIDAELVMGRMLGSHGSYELSGDGALSSEGLFVGLAGAGTFEQNGGQVRTEVLAVSDNNDSPGEYRLNAGELETANTYMNNGSVFVQRGGAHGIANTLTMADDSDSVATYELHSGTLEASREIIGEMAVFRQSGGVHTVSDRMDINAPYHLTGGRLILRNAILDSRGALLLSDESSHVTIRNTLRFERSDAIVTPPNTAVHLTGGQFDHHVYVREATDTRWLLNLVVENPGQTLNMETSSVLIDDVARHSPLGHVRLGDIQPGRVLLVDRFDNNQSGFFGDEIAWFQALTVSAGSRLDLGGRELVVADTELVLEGDLLLSGGCLRLGGEMHVSETARLQGPGSVIGSVHSAGLTVLPSGQASVQIQGDFLQSESGRLRFGGFSRTEHLEVTGSTELRGAIEVTLSDSSTPVPGDRIVLIRSGEYSGAFDSMTLPPVVNGVGWRLDYESDSVVMTAAVAGRPRIFAHPQDAWVTLGQSARFAAEISSLAEVTVQWFKDGQPIPDATTPELILPSVDPAAAGVYSMEVTNAFGTTRSRSATLVVNQPGAPIVLQAPGDQTVFEGETVELTVHATADLAPRFQWHFNGEDLVGATEAALLLEDITSEQAGLYSVRVYNANGHVIAGPALLRVEAASPPTIAEPPVDLHVTPGQSATLNARAAGLPEPSYQWFHDGALIDGATGPSLVIENAGPEHAGLYTVRATNVAGSATSRAARLTVGIRPGNALWTFEVGGEIAFAPALGIDGSIYFGTDGGDNTLYALKPDGSVAWMAPLETGILSAPAVGNDGTIYVPYGGNIAALDPTDGAIRWEHHFDVNPLSSPALGGDGTVYIGSRNGSLYALSPDGSPQWAFDTGFTIISSPAVGGNGTIYFGSLVGAFFAADNGGNKLWEFSIPQGVGSSPAVAQDGTVYVGGLDGAMHAFDRSGAQTWAFETGSSIELGSPVIGADGRIVFGVQNGTVFALDPDGGELWRFQTGGRIDTVPALGAAGEVFVGNADRRLSAISAAGTLMWSYEAGGPLKSPLLTPDGRLYVGSADGVFHAVLAGSPPADSPWPQFHRNPRRTGLADPVPVVALGSPANGAEFIDGETVVLEADASIGGGSISSVDFVANGLLLGRDMDPPFRWEWTTAPAGIYELRAVANTESGLSRSSAPVWISVTSTQGEPVVVYTSGNGRVERSPNSPGYPEGTEVTLTAIPGSLHRFAGWSDSVADNPRTVTIGAGAPGTLTARFEPIQPVTRSTVKVWDMSWGGLSRDQIGAVAIDSLGSLWLVGSSDSAVSGNKSAPQFGDADIWVIQASPSGDPIWQRTYGGEAFDGAGSLILTPDGGALLGGSSRSQGSADGIKKSSNLGGSDFWLIRIDPAGDVVWERSFGGRNDDFLADARQTIDGGFLIGGTSQSPPSGNKRSDQWGGEDFWVMKLNRDGDVQWERSFGSPGQDVLSAIVTMPDGHSLVGGSAWFEPGGNKTSVGTGDMDMWILELDVAGNVVWERSYGGTRSEELTTIVQTPEGGFLLGGNSTSSIGGDKKSAGFSENDYWILKIDADGNPEWDATYGGEGQDLLDSILVTDSGGYLLGGTSNSVEGGNKTEPRIGRGDFWVIRTDHLGSKLWESVFGGGGNDALHAMAPLANGEFFLIGDSSSSIGVSKSAPLYGNTDGWGLRIADVTAPVGYPWVLVDNRLISPGDTVSIVESATVRLQSSLDDAGLFYSLDGTDPSPDGLTYSGPFLIDSPAVLRILVIREEPALSVEAAPILVEVRHRFLAWTRGGGRVNSTPDDASIPPGDAVQLEAIPETGWQFVAWRGDVDGDANPTAVVVRGPTSAEAVFGTTINSSVTENGSIHIEPNSLIHPHGSKVRAQAVPAPGYYFLGWKGDVSGAENPIDVDVDRPEMHLEAVFAPLTAGQAGFQIQVHGSGRVVVEPNQAVYEFGQQVVLHAIPGVGQVFDRWTGDVASNVNPLRVTLNGSFMVDANFGYTLSTSVIGRGSVRIEPPNAVFPPGSNPVLTVEPASGFRFSRWLDGNAANPRTLQVNQSRHYTAVMEPVVAMDEIVLIDWQRSYGGELDDILTTVGTGRHGRILAGGLSLSGADGSKTVAGFGGEDIWLVESDSTGMPVKQWSFGGPGDDRMDDVLATPDGGVLIAGSSASGVGGTKAIPGYGNTDYWVIKLGPNGEQQWQKVFGGSSGERLGRVLPLSDGGFLLGGSSQSSDGIEGNRTAPHRGASDIWLIRVDSEGRETWQTSYGGNSTEQFGDVRTVGDDGFIVGGASSSMPGGNKTAENFGGLDFWVLRLDSNGAIRWQRTFGGSRSEGIVAIEPTLDGGFLLAGQSTSGIGGSKTSPNFGSADFWIVKMDADGVEQWQRTYGGSEDDVLYDVALAWDGGFILGGESRSFIPSGNKNEPGFGQADYWVVRLDSDGNKVWEKVFGGEFNDTLTSMTTLPDGALLLGGHSWSGVEGNKTTTPFGRPDYWLIKLDTRLRPAGQPRLLLDGEIVTDSEWTRSVSARVEFQSSIATSRIHFTLDGSAPGPDSAVYTEPFVLAESALVRAVSVAPTGSVSIEMDPVRIVIMVPWSVTANGGGRVIPDTSDSPVPHGTVIQLRAESNPGWEFLGWTGSVSGVDPDQTLTVDSPKAIEAVFGTSIRLESTGSGDGTIRLEPDLSKYPFGTVISVHARPDSGSYFESWTSGPTEAHGAATYSVTIADPLIGARFELLGPDNVTLTLDIDHGGSVTTVPRKNVYEKGESVSLFAEPWNEDHVFVGWTGDAQGETNPLMLKLDTSQSVGARFGSILSVSVHGIGTVLRIPDQPYYARGDQVRLDAVPGPFSVFDHWRDDASGTTRWIEIGSDNHVHAVFVNRIIADVLWEETAGGSMEDQIYSVLPGADGSISTGGVSHSGVGGNKSTGHFGVGDFWVVDYDRAGNESVEHIFGGGETDILRSIVPIPDGGRLLAGWSWADRDQAGNKTTPGFGAFDYWAVRVDRDDVIQWQASFGGESQDLLNAALPMPDGGFLLGGTSASLADGNKTFPNLGGRDFWVIRVDKDGKKLWERVFGGSGEDYLTAMTFASNGDILLAGHSDSPVSSFKTATHFGDRDYWIVRMNPNGRKRWEAAYGGNQADELTAMVATRDGGFLLGGHSQSGPVGNKTAAPHGAEDYWLVKIDQDGAIEWDVSHGGTDRELLGGILQVAGGGYLVAGSSFSGASGNKETDGFGNADFWIIKTDEVGQKEAEFVFGGFGDDILNTIAGSPTGTFFAAGATGSDVSGNKTTPKIPGPGQLDNWIIKFVLKDLGLVIQPGNGRITFETLDGRLYQVQYSDDALVWVSVEPLIPGTGAPVLWEDPNPPAIGRPSRLYRVIIDP